MINGALQTRHRDRESVDFARESIDARFQLETAFSVECVLVVTQGLRLLPQIAETGNEPAK
jgi:hypothetical protein